MMYPFLPLLAQPYKLLWLPLRLNSSKYIISAWFSVLTCWIYADSTTFLKWSFFWLTLLVVASLFATQIQLFSHYSPDCGHRYGLRSACFINSSSDFWYGVLLILLPTNKISGRLNFSLGILLFAVLRIFIGSPVQVHSFSQNSINLITQSRSRNLILLLDWRFGPLRYSALYISFSQVFIW